MKKNKRMKRIAMLLLYLFILPLTTLYASEPATLGNERTEADAEEAVPSGESESDTAEIDLEEDIDNVSEMAVETVIDTDSEDVLERNLSAATDTGSSETSENAMSDIAASDSTVVSATTSTVSTESAPNELSHNSTEDSSEAVSEGGATAEIAAMDETAAEDPDTMESEPIEIPEVVANAAVMIDAETGLILYDKDKDLQCYPASVTKIMTALLTLELCEDLSKPLTFSHNSIYSLPRDASHIAMDEGETLTILDALHGLMLASANEVANALAEHIAGSTEDFAELMNKRAESLGATSTHFTNSHGLFSPEHYSTAYDMALIMREAVKHPMFNDIIAKRRYDIPPTEKQPNARELLNSNRLIQPGPYFNEWVVGGKTGYTDEAQHTLVTYAVKDGRALITAVMMDERNAAFTDTSSMLEYGFALPYESRLIFDSTAYTRALPVYHIKEDVRELIGEASLVGESDLYTQVPVILEASDIRFELQVPNDLQAPVYAGDEIGQVVCYAQDVIVGSVVLTSSDTVLAPLPTHARSSSPSTELEKLQTTETTDIADTEPVIPDNQTDNHLYNAWEDNYIVTLIVPLAVSIGGLVLSIVLFFFRRKRRRAKIIHFDRYTRIGGNAYHYRP